MAQGYSIPGVSPKGVNVDGTLAGWVPPSLPSIAPTAMQWLTSGRALTVSSTLVRHWGGMWGRPMPSELCKAIGPEEIG